MESDGISGVIKALARLFGSPRGNVTEEEILMMVDAGSDAGEIEAHEREMINNIFELDDLAACDVMTHRTDITAVSSSALVSEVIKASLDTGFSRIPVYEESIDHVIGVICVKDLLCLVGDANADQTDIKTFMRELICLPQTLPCREIFKRLTANKSHMAVIIDEYGGTAGIVTMEDVIEAIVGNIQDEFDNEEEELIQISEDTYTISGTAAPEPILEQLGITLPEDNDFDTMSGFIVDLLGRIPESGETPEVEYQDVAFTVLNTEDMCVKKIKARLLNGQSEEKGD